MFDNKRIVLKAELIFKILYLMDVLLAFNGFVSGSCYITYFNYYLVLFGGVLLLIRLFNYKNYIKTPYLFLLVLFCASMIISAFINRKYGITENIQSLIWTTLQFGLLYVCDKTCEPKDYKKEFLILASIFCIYVFIANIIGIVMFSMNYGAFGDYSPCNGNIVGYMWNRLWGVYLDPNNGSVFAAASVVLSICAFVGTKKKVLLKIALIINVISDYIYIILSDSRTGLVCVIIGVTFTVFLLSLNKIKSQGLLFIKRLSCLLMSFVISIGCFYAFIGLKYVYNIAAENIYLAKVESNSNNDSDDKNNNLTKPMFITGRDSEETESDISNRRFSLWKSGIDIWKTAPIFGVSERNIEQYAIDVVPDTYMVNNDYGNFNSTHNMFLDVLVSQGILGLSILVLFFVLIAVLLIKQLGFNKALSGDTSKPYISAILGLLAVFASSSMFVLDVIYLNSSVTVLFWSSLGYLVHYVRNACKSTKITESK